MGKQYSFWSDEEKKYLSEIVEGRHYSEITKMMNDKFDRKFTNSMISHAIIRYGLKTGFDGRFKKGKLPNDYSFKKGHISKNRKEIGSELIVAGYIKVKVANPSVWKFKHRLMYEKYHNVKLTSEDIILFADRDKTNFSKENLILIKIPQLAVLNRNKMINKNSELTKVGVNLANLMIAISEKGKTKDE